MDKEEKSIFNEIANFGSKVQSVMKNQHDENKVYNNYRRHVDPLYKADNNKGRQIVKPQMDHIKHEHVNYNHRVNSMLKSLK